MRGLKITCSLGTSVYLGVMHSFHIATEVGTREGLHNNVFGGSFRALGAMHGWSDGDGYYENYLGHPIEGAVSGHTWVQNDPRYRAVQFGTDRDYWRAASAPSAYGAWWWPKASGSNQALACGQLRLGRARVTKGKARPEPWG